MKKYYSIPELDLDKIQTKKTKFSISDELIENCHQYIKQLSRHFILGEIVNQFNISISVAEEILNILIKDKKVIQFSDENKKKLGIDIRNNIFISK